MIWTLVKRADKHARLIADRHYNRQSVGAVNFVPPGRCKVFLSALGSAAWVTSWPYAEFVKHAWAGAWVNSLFRRERSGAEGYAGFEDDHPASAMIREAIAATRSFKRWKIPPAAGIVTFVDPDEVPSVPRRRHDCAVNCGRRAIYGYSYERAGFRHAGFTAGGLWSWQMLPEQMPPAEAPINAQHEIEWEVA